MATIRIKKRLDQGGASGGAPSQLKPSELAFNEVDKKLYYGLGESGGNASSIIAIGGDGGFLSLSGAQTAAGNKTFSNDVVISGNLTVNGTTTSISSSTIDVEDKNIEIGKVSSPSDTTADGGGLTLKGASDKTFNWVNSTDAWTSSEHIDLASGKVLKVAGTQVLSATNFTGTSATTTALATGRTVGMTGDVVWTSASFDGTGNVTGTSTIQADAVDMAMLNASGTASSSTFLRGDGAWSTVSTTDTTYGVSCVDGDNSDEEKIRLTASSGGTDDVVLEAGTGLSVARSGDKITFTNTVSDTNTTYSAGSGLSLSGTTFSVDTLNQNTTGSAATLTTARNIGGVSFNGSANIDLPGVNSAGNQNTSGTAAIATTITVDDESSDTTCFPLFVDTDTGNLSAKSGSNLTFNSSSGLLTATQVDGIIDGGSF